MAKNDMPALRVGMDQARALWITKQELVDPPGGDVADVVARTGWVRTLGGIDVYLSVRARCPKMKRADLDGAVDRGELVVIPAVRGCIYLVPAADAPDALAYAAEIARPRTGRELEKAGSDWDEVNALGEAVLVALNDGPLTTVQLRKALPAGMVRSLGPAGKKVGLSSPLPVALRELEFAGDIQRTLEGGRLDTERYLWRRVRKRRKSGNHRTGLAGIVARLLAFAGPLTPKQIATWTGAAQRDLKAALETLDVELVAVDGLGDAWIAADDVDALAAAKPLRKGVAFLPFEDLPLTVHDGPAAHVDPVHHDHPVKAWGSSRPTTLGAARHVHQRTVMIGDRLAGFWEYDPDRAELVVRGFDKIAGHKKTATELARFIHDELGHARSFSLDTDDAVRDRAAALR